MDEDATDTKPSNVRVFHLAEIPSTTETVEIIDEEDDQSQTLDVLSEISTVNTSALFKLKSDRHKVLLFLALSRSPVRSLSVCLSSPSLSKALNLHLLGSD